MVQRATGVDGQRRKKLIAALLLSTDNVLAKAYNCRTCTKEERELQGCEGPVSKDEYPRGIWRVGICIHCDGSDGECEYCMGSGEMPVFQCPRALVTPMALKLLPYFFDHYRALKNGGSVWPDGKGRYYQPIKLVQAFEALTRVMAHQEEMNNAKGN